MQPYWSAILSKIIRDPRYLANIKYGKPRRGHGEGTVEAHIEELERNLYALDLEESDSYWKLSVLIHVHDSFKAEAKRNAPILDPQSHASLAKEFLAEFTDDKDMLTIVQYHDLNYAVYKNWKETGKLNEERMLDALDKIENLNLFLRFCIIDACTDSKGREMITWFVQWVNANYDVTVTTDDILPGKMVNGEAW